jgi:endonuclease YncB( thermonuclease family)
LASIVIFFTAHAAEMLDGRVVGVHDGDTITLFMDGNHTIKVRLAQIDAPESKQPFGNQSKKSLSDMVFKKAIRVEKETSINTVGRLVHF